jgi:dynein heavy chain
MDPKKQVHPVALGDGQDVVALGKLELGHKEGHWIFLQNIQLMPDFLKTLEKKLDEYSIEGSNQNFRLFLSSDPAKTIPPGLLERAIKLTNEPPAGLKANMKRAMSQFNKEEFDEKESKIRTILFGLCYFHSVMLERRKFGPKGWNRGYPFSAGDLRDSSIVLNNYLEQNAASGKIPWDDLKYIFGEIMYGGHITDDRDRRLCETYLNSVMKDDLFDDVELFPYVDREMFKCPVGQTFERYLEHIQEAPPETPNAYGLHSNAEIDFLTLQCEILFSTLQEIQPQGGGSGDGGGNPVQERVQEFMSRVYDEHSLAPIPYDEVVGRIGEEARTPFQNTFLQEIGYMNVLINLILQNLSDIALAFKGELTLTGEMEALMNSIFMNKVPPGWTKYAFPSERNLNAWLDNVRHRLDQLNAWKEDPAKLPKVTFLNRLFNPQSFLTAIKQVKAKEGIELNKMMIYTNVLKKLYWDEDLPEIKEGALIWGFQVEGARWDPQVSQLEESFPKRSFSVVPVIHCCANITSEKEDKNAYICPIYLTVARGVTYVDNAQMRTTKHPPEKWIIAGVAIILDIQGISDSYQIGKNTPLQ